MAVYWLPRRGSTALALGSGNLRGVRRKGNGVQDRGSKATLPLTIPRRVFKSSAKDSTRRSVEIVLQGGPRGSSAAGAWPTTRAFGDPRTPTAGRQTGGGRMRRF
ncbi:hypothetical protein RJ639_029414 [Escallonia herrerae]|uniref:Uncharacterized protein n=1 Tax=Escallonia herrerae TaxID=1293975 RepID=A0AA88TYY9_9ASTE|nr:hypothetical protein RJ639_029414 [Escallonia herrerae]